MIGVNIDVTERKEMEAALEQSRKDQARLYAELEARLHELEAAQEQVLRAGKLAAVGQLATGVAHEINNPLATIMGQTEMLKRRLTDPGAHRARDQDRGQRPAGGPERAEASDVHQTGARRGGATRRAGDHPNRRRPA